MTTHNKKVKIARGLMSKEELSRGVPLFKSFGWLSRKRDIANRVDKVQRQAHDRKIVRDMLKEKEAKKQLIK